MAAGQIGRLWTPEAQEGPCIPGGGFHAAAPARESPGLQRGPADVRTDPVSSSLLHLPEVGMKHAAQMP